jgi:hypothetical protein
VRYVAVVGAVLLGASCASGGAGQAAPSSAVTQALPPAPIAPPRPGIRGCVESPELKAYVEALETRRQQARAAALAAEGARPDARAAFFGAAGVSRPLGETYAVGGKRVAVVAQMATRSAPQVALSQQNDSLRPIHERPRAHPVPVRVCGTRACALPERVVVPVRPVLVELGPGEVLGAPLTLSYDFWWAQVSYAQEQQCSTPRPAPE